MFNQNVKPPKNKIGRAVNVAKMSRMQLNQAKKPARPNKNMQVSNLATKNNSSTTHEEMHNHGNAKSSQVMCEQ